MPPKTAIWIALLAQLFCMLSGKPANAQFGFEQALHITTYYSASNQFSLTIDPSRLHGGGSGSYRVERNNELVWERQFDFTLCKALISDDGITVGYGYTSGASGHDGSGRGELVIAILGPEGEVKRIPSPTHSPTND